MKKNIFVSGILVFCFSVFFILVTDWNPFKTLDLVTLERELTDKAIEYEIRRLGDQLDGEYTVQRYRSEFPDCCRFRSWSRGITGYYNLMLSIEGPDYTSNYWVSKYGVDWSGWPK